MNEHHKEPQQTLTNSEVAQGQGMLEKMVAMETELERRVFRNNLNNSKIII